MNDKFNIEELFRTKLESVEQEPSVAVWEKTVRTLRWKQFFRFNASRFNVYYLAGVAVISAIVSMAVLTNNEKQDRAEVSDEGVEVQDVDTNSAPEEANNEKEVTKGKEIREQKVIPTETTKEAPKADKDKTVNVPEEASEPDADKERSEFKANDEEDLSGPVSTMVAFFTASTLKGCAPLTVEFTNTSVNAREILWNFGDVAQPSTLSVQRVIFEEPGTYPVTLTATDHNGLQLTYSEKITVHPQPAAEFEIVEDQVYNYTSGAVEYHWSLVNDMNHSAQLISTEFQPINFPMTVERRDESSGAVMLVAKNIFGCTDTVVQKIPGTGQPELTFPNAFSPDLNGPNGGYYNLNEPSNQVFHPKYKERPATYTLEIFSRSGELIFKTHDLETGWDGYHQEAPAPRGVYIYQCTGTWKNGQPFSTRGDITLLRNE